MPQFQKVNLRLEKINNHEKPFLISGERYQGAELLWVISSCRKFCFLHFFLPNLHILFV